MPSETEQQRRRRHYQRSLFDSVADLYDASRRAYPDELTSFMVATAALHRGSAVLEVGCGTGQMTKHLADRDFDLTAIDIGPAMIAAARRRLDGLHASFRLVSFEDLDAPTAAFDLVVSATAFHWVDPEVRFVKAARLLRPGGWLALLSTGEKYDDPLGAALREMWIARSDDGGAWARQRKPSDAEVIAASGLFDSPIEKRHSQRIVLPRETVIGVESTRSTSLSWPEPVRRAFIDELRHHLRSQAQVNLAQETALTMARVSSA